MAPFPEIVFPFTDPVLIVATVMAIILFAPQLFARFRIPGIVGLIFAGAAVGPSALNMLQRDSTMVLLGTIGLLYLMFGAGISLDLNRFSKYRTRSIVFGLASFLIPQIITVGFTLLVLEFSLPAALLLGSIVGSHTLVAFPIAARLGLNKNTAVTMTVGGTIVTDSLSLAILAGVIATLGQAPTVGYWVSFGSMVAVFVAIVLIGLPKLGFWFFRTVRNKPEVEFAFLMTVLFATSFAAQYVGLAPIIGAFLAGLAVNRLIPEQSTLMSRIRFTGDALFIPFFLISVGLLVDFRELVKSLEIWFLAGVLITLVCAGKLLAAKLAERAFGYSSAEGWLIFGLSVPQAAATLAVTLIGFEVGLFSTAMVNAVVVMILFTCVLGPFLVEKFGRQIARDEEAEPIEPSSAPERILVPLANPKTSDYLIDMALFIHEPTSEQPIYPLMVVSEGSNVEERLIAKQEKLKHAVTRITDAQVNAVPLTRIDPNTAHGIARAVREEGISMIVIGWNGEVSTRERIFGTVLDQLLDETTQMVFVNKLDHPLNTTARVVLAIPPFAERGPGFFEAVHAVKLIAARVDAGLKVICEKRHIEHDRELISRTKPDVPTHYSPVENWSDVKGAFDKAVAEHTHVIVLSARRGSAPWFAELDNLPRIIAENYSGVSFSIVYLAEA
ncbi:MAG: cation:proton antiporter [Bradymonadaceae bacterium]|nr:cation:proton antiporter [Lujinxingiaceae bacterium]